jgi:hypothetical protein
MPTTETQHRVHESLEGITARARWELPLSFHTEAFESSETEKENYCLLRAEILLRRETKRLYQEWCLSGTTHCVI